MASFKAWDRPDYGSLLKQQHAELSNMHVDNDKGFVQRFLQRPGSGDARRSTNRAAAGAPTPLKAMPNSSLPPPISVGHRAPHAASVTIRDGSFADNTSSLISPSMRPGSAPVQGPIRRNDISSPRGVSFAHLSGRFGMSGIASPQVSSPKAHTQSSNLTQSHLTEALRLTNVMLDRHKLVGSNLSVEDVALLRSIAAHIPFVSEPGGTSIGGTSSIASFDSHQLNAVRKLEVTSATKHELLSQLRGVFPEADNLKLWVVDQDWLVLDGVEAIHRTEWENRTGAKCLPRKEVTRYSTTLYCPVVNSEGESAAVIEVVFPDDRQCQASAINARDILPVCTPPVLGYLAMHRQKRVFTLVTDIMASIFDATQGRSSVDVVCYSAAKLLKEHIGCERCSFFLYADSVLWEYTHEEVKAIDGPHMWAAHHVMRTGKRAVWNRQNSPSDSVMPPGLESGVVLPIKRQDQIMAVVYVENKVPFCGTTLSSPKNLGFNTQDLEVLDAVAPLLAAQLHSMSNESQSLLATAQGGDGKALLAAITELTSSDLASKSSVMEYTMEAAKKLLNAERVSLFLVDKEHNMLYPALATGTTQQIRMPIGRGIAGQVASTGQSENVADAYNDPRFNKTFDLESGFRTKSMLAMPIMFRGELIAVAQVINKMDATGEVVVFNPSDEAAFKNFALFAGLAISSSNMIEFAVKAGNEAVELSQGPKKHALKGKLAGVNLETLDHLERAYNRQDFVAALENAHLPDFSLFDIRDLHPREAHDIACMVFVELMKRSGYVKLFNLDVESLKHFVLAVRARYRNVPYHNFFHAVDVFQTVYTFLFSGGVREMLTDVDCFALLIAAICHDIDHMGLNNSFHLKTESPLGILSSQSGNNSVLEVHHCNLTIHILEHAEADVFATLKGEDLKRAYRVLVDSILATDMGKHGEIVKQFDDLVARGFDRTSDDDRSFVAGVIMKAADISNVTKPFEISSQWATCVTEEFYCQGDKEREQGHTPMPMFDRQLGTELAKGQMGFISFLGEPFFKKIVSQLFDKMTFTTANIAENKRRWEMELLSNA